MAKQRGRQSILRKVKIKGVEKWNAPILTFLDGIKIGMTTVKACHYAGFSEDAFYEWQQKATDDFAVGKDSIHTEFIEEFKKAKASCQQFCLNSIYQAAQNGSWQAGAWILERVFNKDFAQKQQLEIEDKVEIVNDIPKM